MGPFHWTCPYCDRDTTIQDTNVSTGTFALTIGNADGMRLFNSLLIVCPNPSCRKFTLTISHYGYLQRGNAWVASDLIQRWNLIPPSSARVFPDYVPQPIRDDYVEACNIRDLSPKASATLSRRCLQGMIRDFWEIKKKRLFEEIEALEGKIDSDTWEAIDAVRKIGNIGAHMEQDINVLIDVDEGEAQKLIELIELLVKDWYIARHQRKERLTAIKAVGDAKDAQKNAATTAPPAATGPTIP